MESHSFNTTIAKELGMVSATIFNNFVNWYKLNKANNRHFYDDRYWTYNSIKSFGLIYDYLTERQIRYGIKNLIDAGYIITGNYNEKKYDQTLWYTLTDKSLQLLNLPICQICQMELTKMSNGVDKFVKPIPDTNTDIITNTNTIVQFKDELERAFNILWDKLPRKQDKEAAKKKWMKLNKQEFEEIRVSIKKHIDHWNLMITRGEGQYIPLFSTFLNNKRWRDEIKQQTTSSSPHRLAL